MPGNDRNIYDTQTSGVWQRAGADVRGEYKLAMALEFTSQVRSLVSTICKLGSAFRSGKGAAVYVAPVLTRADPVCYGRQPAAPS